MGKVAAKLWDRRAHPPRTLHHATPAPCATTPVALGEWPRTPPVFSGGKTRATQARCPARPLLVAPAHRISLGIAHTSQMPPSPSGGGRAGPAPLDAGPRVPARPGHCRPKFARGRTSANASRTWRTASRYVLGQRLQRSWHAILLAPSCPGLQMRDRNSSKQIAGAPPRRVLNLQSQV